MGAILILDDDQEILTLAGIALSLYGYEVHKAENVAAAKQCFSAGAVDVVLSDVCLPGGSGLEFLDWVHSHSKHTRVILMSGFMDEAIRGHARVHGAVRFLAKPFTLEQLRSAVSEAFLLGDRDLACAA